MRLYTWTQTKCSLLFFDVTCLRYGVTLRSVRGSKISDTVLDTLRILSCDIGSFALHGKHLMGFRAPRTLYIEVRRRICHLVSEATDDVLKSQ
jgi:hypothetical protein